MTLWASHSARCHERKIKDSASSEQEDCVSGKIKHNVRSWSRGRPQVQYKRDCAMYD